jgi:transcriptional regulator with XRE-family HTH domain
MALTISQQISIRELIKNEIDAMDLSQKQVAMKLGLDPSAVSKHLHGGTEMTLEIFRQYANKLGSMRLRMEYNKINNVGIGCQEYLDAVDLNPAVVQLVLGQELDEAVNSMKTVNLANKRSAKDLTQEQHAAVLSLIDQLLDVKAGTEHFLITCADTYGIDPDQATLRWSRKVRDRGYVTVCGSNVVPMVPSGIAAGGTGGCA